MAGPLPEKDLEKLGVEYFSEHQSADTNVPALVTCLRKINNSASLTILVVGCGPHPSTMRALKERGFNVCGVEPIEDYVRSANEELGAASVRVGDAEHLPYEDKSVDVVVSESVLEHVESPSMSVGEAFRVLRRGGIAYFYTTNRFHFSPSGYNGEYRIPFFNWLPTVVQESYVYKHLHIDPRLANFSPRPAVHWFCYTDLCELGRDAGFFKFYSMLDLLDEDAPAVARSTLRRLFVRRFRSNPWLRGLALLQFGNTIFMYKR